MKNRNVSRRLVTSARGFTLIEITIVLVIAAIILAAVLSAAKPYFAEKSRERTISAVKTVDRALEEYLSENGRYPCPAPLNSTRGVAIDGTEDCSVGPYSGPNFWDVPGRDPGTGPLTVRIGAVPYRELDIPADATIDHLGNRLTYAVSYNSATAYNDIITGGALDPGYSGAIDVVDESGTSILNIPGSGHYIVFSHGIQGMGAFTDAGVPHGFACDPARLEFQNCDRVDGTFLAAQQSLGTEAAYSDDISNYSLLIEADLEDSLWARSPADQDNIYNLNAGNVGIGGPGMDVTHALTVETPRGSGPGNHVALLKLSKLPDPAWGVPAIDGTATGIRFQVPNDAGVQINSGHIFSGLADVSAGNELGFTALRAYDPSTSTSDEQVRILGNDRVGILTQTPETTLDVQGEVKVGNTGQACNANTRGSIRYNSASGGMLEFCSETGWKSQAPGPMLLAHNKRYYQNTVVAAGTCSLIEVQARLRGVRQDGDGNSHLQLTMRSNGSTLSGQPLRMQGEKTGSSGHGWFYGGSISMSYFIQNTSISNNISGSISNNNYQFSTSTGARYDVICYP